MREREHEEDDEECNPKPWWIYKGSTPTIWLLGFLENRARRAAFTPEMLACFLGTLDGPSGSTTEVA